MAIIDPDAGWKEPVRQKTTDPGWTVLIFAGADTIGNNADLRQAFRDDLEEIKAVGGGGDHQLDIFIQVHGDGDARRYHFGQTPEGKSVMLEAPVPAEQQNYEGGQALAAFIETSLMRVRHLPGHRSLLVFWGHAYRIRVRAGVYR